MKNIYNDKFDMTPQQLKEKREKENKDTEKILQDFLYQKSLGSLNKPSLGEKLALVLKEEMESNNEREKTEPEKILEKIVSRVKENET